MSRSDKNLYKVKATMMIPLEVEVLIYEDTPKDAEITVACLSIENRYDESIQLNEDMYASYEIDPLKQLLENTGRS